MSYESEMKALTEERKRRGLEILEKYKSATPSGVLDNHEETKEFQKLSMELKLKRKAIMKKYGKK